MNKTQKCCLLLLLLATTASSICLTLDWSAGSLSTSNGITSVDSFTVQAFRSNGDPVSYPELSNMTIYDHNYVPIETVHPQSNAYTWFNLTADRYIVEVYVDDMYSNDTGFVSVINGAHVIENVTVFDQVRLKVGVVCNDDKTPLPNAEVRIQSYLQVENNSPKAWRVNSTDNLGIVTFYLQPTTIFKNWTHYEHYEASVYYDGMRVGNNSSIVLPKDQNSYIVIISSVPPPSNPLDLLSNPIVATVVGGLILASILWIASKLRRLLNRAKDDDANRNGKVLRGPTPMVSHMKWDLFICHASEDKSEVAEPLAKMLEDANVKVWYDKFTLLVGDSLRQKIDEGLANSRYGVVILSPSFFKKNWPQKELDGLAAREDTEGHKVILPVWHNVDQNYVVKFSPTLANRLAAKTSDGLETVLEELLKVIRQRDP